MSLKKLIFTYIIILCFTTFSFAQTINSELSKATFSISNMGFRTVEGTLTGMNGTLNFNPDDLSNASFNVCIDPASVDTGSKKRDEHLEKDDFFNVAKYLTICFESSSVTRSKEGYFTKGMLTMLGISKEVSINFKLNKGQFFEGNLTINRTDFNLGPSGGFLVGKTVEVEILCISQD